MMDPLEMTDTLQRERERERLDRFSYTSIHKGKSEEDLSGRHQVQSIQVLKMFVCRSTTIIQHGATVRYPMYTFSWQMKNGEK
jgi:hypothetical protein